MLEATAAAGSRELPDLPAPAVAAPAATEAPAVVVFMALPALRVSDSRSGPDGVPPGGVRR